MTDPPNTADAPLLRADALGKRFDHVVALHEVDFEVRAGEVVALMGENGAGKSTLVKCLAGVHRPTSGSMTFAMAPYAPTSPRHAESLGVSTVFQEVNLIPHMSVAENICLGREPVRPWLGRTVRWGEVRQRALAALERLGVRVDVSRELSACSVALQQLVAIARALDVRARVLILDEPTSSLDERECAELFGVMRTLKSQGMGIVFITHFLDQVDAVADRVTILRDARLVGAFPARSLSRTELVGHMLGRTLETTLAPHAKGTPSPIPSATPLVRARALSRRGALEHVDLDIHPGEAVGLAGLLGSGRSETARALFGADPLDAGTIDIDGRPAHARSPRHACRLGLALTTENRRADGIIPHLSVRENIALALQARRGVARPLSRREQLHLADRFIAALRIKTPSPETPIANLSGGNQQKTLLARWLATEPRLLMLDEPTRGIDVGAKAEVLRLVDELRSKGMSLLVISSELEEVLHACGRIVVLRDRRSIADLAGPDCTMQNILAAIAGTSPGEPSHA